MQCAQTLRPGTAAACAENPTCVTALQGGELGGERCLGGFLHAAPRVNNGQHASSFLWSSWTTPRYGQLNYEVALEIRTQVREIKWLVKRCVPSLEQGSNSSPQSSGHFCHRKHFAECCWSKDKLKFSVFAATKAEMRQLRSAKDWLSSPGRKITVKIITVAKHMNMQNLSIYEDAP